MNYLPKILISTSALTISGLIMAKKSHTHNGCGFFTYKKLIY